MAGKKPLSLITFDIDDTLYSSTEFAHKARENAMKAMIAAGLRMDLKNAMSELDEVVSEFTSNDERHFDRLLQRIPAEWLSGINPAILVATGVVAYHDTKHDNLMAYEDAIECIRTLKQSGFKVGIVSQGFTIKQAEKIIRLRILPFLDKRALFFSDQLGCSKGNPKFYQRAAQMMNAPARHCLHIGDRPDRDIDPANEAGWLTVLNRRTGRYHERPGLTPAAYTIHNFYDLLEIIQKEYEPANT